METKSILWKNRDGELVTITPDDYKVASIFYGKDSNAATVEYYDKLAEQVKPSKNMQRTEDEIESELVEEILQKFGEIGIDTSEWEYKFGDGNFAAEFIQAGIKDYLEKLNRSSAIVWVKASERLPEEAKLVFIRGQKTYMIVGRYIGERLFNGNRHEPMFTDFSNNEKLNWQFDDIEWLEEQPNPVDNKVESEEKNYEPEVRNTNEADVASHSCTSNNSIQLLIALLNGKTLIRGEEFREQKLWCEWFKEKPYFYVHGWGSAFGNAMDRVIGIIETNGAEWSIELPNDPVSDTTKAQSMDEPLLPNKNLES